MDKAHLYEAVFLVNRGIDEAVRGLQRLQKTSQIEIDPIAEALANFEQFRSRVNLQFLSDLHDGEKKDLKRFVADSEFFAESPLDDPDTAYALVRHFEEQRKEEGKPALVQFLTPLPQHEARPKHDAQKNQPKLTAASN